MNFTRSSSETMTSFQATLVNTGFGQLLLRDSLGKVAQRWTLSNPKCVIGTGTNCNVSCQLPGISDHHVLMVIGAKQVFIRALAAGLTRNGQNIHELVVPGAETEFNFEIAGHHFQFSRESISTPIAKDFVQEAAPARPLFVPSHNDAPLANSQAASTPAGYNSIHNPDQHPEHAAPTNAANSPTLALAPSRLKFTVVRALEKNRQAHADLPSMIEGSSSTSRPAWVEAIVRDALRPVEERLDDLNGPLQNIERRLRRSRAQLRRARKQALAKPEKQVQQFVPVLAPELIQSQAVIEQYIEQHSAQLEKVTQSVNQIVTRLSDFDRYLGTTQVERQELSQQFDSSNQQIATLQREMTNLFAALHSQLSQPAVAQSSAEIRLWQTSVEAQLAELQATLLALDDIKQTLQSAVDQNRNLKNDLENQHQKLGKLIADATQKAVADAMALANNDSEMIGQVVGDKVCDSLREQLGTRFTKEIAEQLSDSLNNEFALPLSNQLSTQLSEQITQQFSNQLSPQLTRDLASLAPPQAPAYSTDEIVQAVRATLTEMLAPLAASLQTSLQQTIQQTVDQSLQLSMRQPAVPVHPTYAPTADHVIPTTLPEHQSEHMHGALPVPALQLPNVDMQQGNLVDDRLPESHYSYSVDAVEDETQTPANDYSSFDCSQGFDSQPYTPPGYQSQSLATPTADSQVYDSQVYDSQAYDSQAYDSQPEGHVNDSQAYDSQAYDSQAYDSQAYDSQAYDSQAYDSQAYESTAYDSQAYDSQSHDSQAYDAQATPTADQPSLGDSHARELPSWWADGQVAADPTSTPYPVSADNDANYSDSRPYAVSEPKSPHEEYDSTYHPINTSEEITDNDAYAQSAFSAEQLDLAAPGSPRSSDAYAEAYTDERVAEPEKREDSDLVYGMQNLGDENPFDSVPYSELVNRKPRPSDDASEPSDYANDYAEYSPRESELMPAGLGDSYSSEPVQDYRAEEYADIAQPEHITQSVPAADNPTVPASDAKANEDTDESVEDYMRRLLARMRGVSESEVTLPGVDSAKPTTPAAAKTPSVAQPTVSEVAEPEGEQLSEAWTEPFDPDKYVPRGAAPEKNRDLNAMRELANTSARSAIQVSARRRQGSAILIKSAIALVGLIAGIALVSINGARINIAFIATIASFLVAIIWGYDASCSIRPLVQANRHQSNQKRSADKAAQTEEAGK